MVQQNIVQQWFKKNLANPQIVVLVLFFFFIIGVFAIASEALAPIITSVVIAYVLNGAILRISMFGIKRGHAFALVFLLFVSILLAVLIVLIPLLIFQITQFLTDLPQIFASGQRFIAEWSEQNSHIVSQEHLTGFIENLRTEITNFTQSFLHTLVKSLGGFITVIVYVVMVPMLVFFFLKDKDLLFKWLLSNMPGKENSQLTSEVWSDINNKTSNYIRGKLIEIGIVWAVCWLCFWTLDLSYAMLLSFFVGLSVIIPYIGATLVTIPIALVAYFQWGISAEFAYLMIAYGIIQFLDANIIVPFLFSEIVKIHPIAIIMAVLVFGGLWGAWGAFFAIPLATVLNAVIRLWPKHAHTLE